MKEESLLKKYRFRFEKKYGQNFIYDPDLLQRIVLRSGITKEDPVLEIGSGAGTLTKLLCAHAKKVLSYEIDGHLKPILEENLRDCHNLELRFRDFLRDPPAEWAEKGLKVVANLPYYVTTPILFRLLEEPNVLEITVMVQKEVARRICAKEGSKDYGPLTVAVQSAADAQIIAEVPREMFEPVPNVDSAVVRIVRDPEKFGGFDAARLRDTVKCVFAMRRKTLVNNLTAAGMRKEDAERLCLKNGWRTDIRAESLSVAELIRLSDSPEFLHKSRN